MAAQDAQLFCGRPTVEEFARIPFAIVWNSGEFHYM